MRGLTRFKGIELGGALFAALLALGACNSNIPEPKAKQKGGAEREPETVDIPQTVTGVAPGTTPMAERTAVIGLLNKRNGISRELTMKPGQALRAGDVIVRLRACETSAPWEIQKLTGTFVQVDVRSPQGQFQRVFSGWLYKETPSLNVVEHPVYDVWPKSCAMTHPGAAADSASEPEPAAKSRSKAPNSAPRASPEPSAPARAKAEDSNAT
jgi:hypothetical protein